MTKLLVIAATLLCVSTLQAQSVDHNALSKTDSLIEQRLYKTAYTQAEKLFAQARKQHDSHGALTAAYLMERAAAYYLEDWADSATARYEALLPTLGPADAAICHALLGNDSAAIANDSVLKATPIDDYTLFCHRKGSAHLLTPTLYDLLMWMAVDNEPSPAKALILNQKLIDFHAADSDFIRLSLDLRQLELIDRTPNRYVTTDTLLNLIAKYNRSSCPLRADLIFNLAQRLNNDGLYLEAAAWCDSALTLYSGSQGASRCHWLKGEIERASINVSMGGVLAAERDEMFSVTHRNVDTLWFRIINATNHGCTSCDKYYSRRKVLGSWSQPVGRDTAHHYRTAMSYLPPLPEGKYELLVSPRKELTDSGLVAVSFTVSDLVVAGTASEGYLLHRTTGRPLPGAQVQLMESRYVRGKKEQRILGSAKSDASGRFAFEGIDLHGYNLSFIVTRGSRRDTISASSYNPKTDRNARTQMHIYTDRPVYHPGEEVSFACLLFSSDRLAEGQTLAERKVKIVFYDINHRVVDSATFVTNRFGVANGSFMVPEGGLNGHMQLEAKSGNTTAYASVRVEEYKQPHFMVQLFGRGADSLLDVPPAFGQPHNIEGLVATYSGAPLVGAAVRYTVTRHSFNYFRCGESSQVVDSGRVAVGDDGRFSVTFVPQPDSNVELSHQPQFRYTVSADVTDLNGETQNAYTSVILGYDNTNLVLYADGTVEELRKVDFDFTDLNNNPLRGEVHLSVEQLDVPAIARQWHPYFIAEAEQPLGRDEFHKRFPQFAYSRVEHEGDTVGREVYSAQMVTAAGKDNSFELPTLNDGRYKLRLVATDALGNRSTAESVVTIMKKNPEKIYVKELLWNNISKKRAKPGERVEIFLGTRHNDLTVTCLAYTDKRHILDTQLTLNNSVASLPIEVDDDLVGGFNIMLIAVKNGETVFEHKFVNVVSPDKEATVKFETFRDKLTPGETETWRIKVNSTQPTDYNLIMTLYDEALNSYGSLGWHSSFWSSAASFSFIDRTVKYSTASNYIHYSPHMAYAAFPTLQWELERNYSNMGYHTMNKGLMRSVRYKESAQPMMMATAAVMEDAEMEEADMAFGDSETNATADAGGVATAEQMVELRSNLNTLAFFEPHAITDSMGSIEYTFTVPELLTRWQLHGLAVSTDLRSATFFKELVTQKQLMVQPNVPRFLRQGDSASFLAKVVNLSDEECEAEVRFQLTDVAPTVRHVKVPANGAASVDFRFVVPATCHVAEYVISAQSSTMSDGERGEIAVLGNRVAVTRSVSVFLNGNDTKSVPLSELTDPVMTKSHQPLLLSVEYTPNPIWQAIKAMPYVEDCQSPSSIYLANSLYINLLSRKIVSQNPTIGTVFAAWKDDTTALTSPLARNEAVKQTLLTASPWLRAAESESEQYRNVAKFFDSKTTDQNIVNIGSKLLDAQHLDGSWSWMPGAPEGSEYVTSVVVGLIGKLGREVVGNELWRAALKGLAYIDREEQAYFSRYIKPQVKKKNLQCNATNINYLYLRSIFEGEKFSGGANEAYTFYYNNALARYSQVTDLYSQAQLALIFHRHNNAKQAANIVQLLKEKSLTNDEFGMYWRDNNGGYYWYKRPIETQAMLVSAFSEVVPADSLDIALMQQWLLKQKQTSHWGNDMATVNAINALLGSGKLATASPASTVVIASDTLRPTEAGSGYTSKTYTGQAFPEGNNQTITFAKAGNGIAWGAAYYQYEDELKNIPSSETGVKLTKKISRLAADGTEIAIKKDGLNVGDKVRVTIDIAIDRTLEYVELVDGRPSCFEPLTTNSGWRWNGGLSYYLSVGNTDMKFYISYATKGNYRVEYDAYVTNPGTFSTGLTTWQCMYAPEFRAVAPAQTINVR